jgi:hypothetical protein
LNQAKHNQHILGAILGILFLPLLLPILLPLLPFVLHKRAPAALLRMRLKLWEVWWRQRNRMVGGMMHLSTADRALRDAALAGDEHNVEIFLRRGANPDLLVDYDWPLLMRVCAAGDTRIARLLLDAGAQIDATNPSTRHTPLMIAGKKGHQATVELLLEYGANIEAMTIAGTTPLVSATMAGQVDVVRVLLQAYTMRGMAPRQGLKALGTAQKNGYAEIVELLHNAGVYNDLDLMRPAHVPCAPPGLHDTQHSL